MFALSLPAFAQKYPTPVDVSKAVPLCTGCAGDNIRHEPNDGLKMTQFADPIKAHVGRTVDSSSTQHYQGPGFRTGRAGKIMSSRITRGSAPPRMYMRIGEAIFAWRLDSFFTQVLPGGPKAVNEFAPSVSGRAPSLPPYEKILMPEAFCYPEYSSSGWVLRNGDVQNTFGDMDFDDRGLIYAGMKDHGWGIVRDSGETGKTSLPLVSPQMPGAPVIPQVIVSLKVGAKYYVGISDAKGLSVALFDATNASNPTPLNSDNQGNVVPRSGSQWGMTSWAKTDSGDRFAYIGGEGDGKLRVFDPGQYISAGTPIAIVTPAAGRELADLAFDEAGNLWIAETRRGAPASNVLRRLTKTGSGYTETSFDVYGENFSPYHIHVADGYVVLSGWGIGSDGVGALDVKLLKIEGSSLRLIDFGRFFSKYYHRAPAGYAQPQTNPPYTSSPFESDVHVIKSGGKLYLMYNAWGVGDVYEINDGGSIAASMKAGFGTPNPYASTTDGPYPGDIVTFNGASSVPGSGGLVWDFGNPEAGAGSNIGSSSNGADIFHQYSGLSTAALISAPKTVNVYEANDQGISTPLTVQLKVPNGRVALPDGSVVTAATSSISVAAGENVADASDGSIESHIVNWTIDGSPVKAMPHQPVGAGVVGQHTLTHSAAYGKYNATSLLSANTPYNTSTLTLNVTVRPFLFTFKQATKNGSAVTFGATPRKTSDTTVMPATQWTSTWTLKKSGSDVVPPQVTTGSTSSIPNFVVTTAIPDGSILTLTLAVDQAGLSAPAQQYSTYTDSLTLDAPDPKISKSGCANALALCTFTAGSVGGKSLTDWNITWSLLQGATEVKSGTGATFAPSIAAAGNYTVKLTATKAIFTTVVTQDINVQAALCGPPVSADFVTIWASCLTGCTANTDISFRPDFYGYSPQDCDQWLWDFGDGTTGSTNGADIFIKHKYASNRSYTVKLTLKNSAGQTVVTPTVIKVGTDTPPPPPPPSCNAPNSTSFTYSGSKGCRAGVDCKAGEVITFTARKNNATLQTCDSVRWTFGDGGSSTLTQPQKTYSGIGSFPVTFNLFNEKGTAEEISQTIKVVEDNTACPVRTVTDVDYYLFFHGRESGCSYANDTLCKPGETIDFQAIGFGYNFQTCDKFEWKFGDGVTATSRETEHKYPTNGGNLFTVSVRVYNTLGEGTNTATIRFPGPPDKPAPVITPNFPKTGGKGGTLTFTATSNMATTTGWTWNFGDGTIDTSQAGAVGSSSTITHSFATAKTYTVTVQARNSESASSALSAIATDQVVISNTPLYTFLLPAVIHDDGLNDSKWRTDVQIYYGAPNPQSTPLAMTASFEGANTDLSINQATFIYEDFMSRLIPGKGQGPVIITTQTAYKPQIWTRTYNVDASGKTYGQFIPAVELTGSTGTTVDGSADPDRYYLSGLRQDSRYRTNVGLINTTTADVIADIVAYDDLQTPLDHFTETLTPFSLKPFSLSKVKGLSNRPVSLEISVPAGKRIVGYASFIDGRSNDPVYISATSAAELSSVEFGTSVTPGVGHIGAWRSDVTIFNPDDRNTATFDLEYYDGTGLRRGLATNLTLGPLQAKNYEDLLKVTGLFNNVPDGVGMLKLTTRSNQARYPLTFSRTYNDKGSGGTFGQGIPGVAASLANVKVGRAAIIPGVRSNTNYKTNIGLTNVTGNAVNVRVQLLDPNTGAVAHEEAYGLAAYASVVGEYPFGSLSTGALKVEITGGDGAVWAFASVIDRNSEDPEYVPASPLQ